MHLEKEIGASGKCLIFAGPTSLVYLSHTDSRVLHCTILLTQLEQGDKYDKRGFGKKDDDKMKMGQLEPDVQIFTNSGMINLE